MIVDFHTHTTASDGRLTPTQLLRAADERQIGALAITDHDTLSGYREAASVSNRFRVRLISGLELSSRWQKIGVHIVGLNVRADSVAMRQAERRQLTARRERAERIAHRLENIAKPGLLGRVALLADGGQIGRPHFARALVDDGVVKNTQAAFAKYLGAGKAGDIRGLWADMATVIEWISAAGGVAVLAHPAKYRLTRARLTALIEDFKSAGGHAMEVISGAQDVATTRQLARFCEDFNLLASQGSDFHQPGQRWCDLGRFPPLPAHLSSVHEYMGVRT